MSPYELVERAVALRVPLYNTLDIEPIKVEGGTLYTVTSGIVAERPLRADTRVEEDEIVRRQVATHPMTLFADVVELRASAVHRDGEAQLYRVESPFDPALAEARAAFRPTVLGAIEPGPDRRLSIFRYNSTNFTAYQTHDEEGTDETILTNNSGYGFVPLLARPDTQVHVEPGKTSELDRERAVRTSLSGPVQVELEPYHIARITNRGVLAGPADEQVIDFAIPEGIPQHMNRGVRDYTRIPDDVTIAPNSDGELVMSGGRANDKKYESIDLRPYVDGRTLTQILPGETIDWKDVTAIFLQNLGEKIAKLLPLDGAVSWEQTVTRARSQVREILLTNREPVLGGIGCLAVAARMSELPGFMDGNYRVDEEYFRRVS